MNTKLTYEAPLMEVIRLSLDSDLCDIVMSKTISSGTVEEPGW